MMGLTWNVLLCPHYFTNILLATSFYIFRITPGICNKLFSRSQLPCNIEWREYEILCFLAIVVVFKNKRAPSWLAYVSSTLQFTKITNIILYFRQDAQYGIIFGILCLLHFLFTTEPSFKGSELVTHFSESSFRLELENRNTTWIIAFSTPWSVMCQQFTPVFSQLASKYSLDNLKFGKIDVNRFQDLAKEYKIDPSATSKMLPTLILFKWGKEAKRRPFIDHKGRIQRYIFSEVNIIADFDLANLYKDNKKNSTNQTSSTLLSSGPVSDEVMEPDADTEEKSKKQVNKSSNKILMQRVSKLN